MRKLSFRPWGSSVGVQNGTLGTCVQKRTADSIESTHNLVLHDEEKLAVVWRVAGQTRDHGTGVLLKLSCVRMAM